MSEDYRLTNFTAPKRNRKMVLNRIQRMF